MINRLADILLALTASAILGQVFNWLIGWPMRHVDLVRGGFNYEHVN